MVVSYDGSSFQGFQTQRHGNTVQDTLERWLSSVIVRWPRTHRRRNRDKVQGVQQKNNGSMCTEALARAAPTAAPPQPPPAAPTSECALPRALLTIIGAGRTDTGVHALGQVVHFDLPLFIEFESNPVNRDDDKDDDDDEQTHRPGPIPNRFRRGEEAQFLWRTLGFLLNDSEKGRAAGTVDASPESAAAKASIRLPSAFELRVTSVATRAAAAMEQVLSAHNGLPSTIQVQSVKVAPRMIDRFLRTSRSALDQKGAAGNDGLVDNEEEDEEEGKRRYDSMTDLEVQGILQEKYRQWCQHNDNDDEEQNGRTRSTVADRESQPEAIPLLHSSMTFHARSSCIGKRYQYRIVEGRGNPFVNTTAWALNLRKNYHGEDCALNLERMREAAAKLEGTHDFAAFGVMESGDKRSTVNHLRRLHVARCGPSIGNGGDGASLEANIASLVSGYGDFSTIVVTAECDRFLYHMMRMIVGTLVQVGLGHMTVNDVVALLEAKVRHIDEKSPAQRNKKKRPSPLTTYKAPAHGLCLERCFYSDGSSSSRYEWRAETGRPWLEKNQGPIGAPLV